MTKTRSTNSGRIQDRRSPGEKALEHVKAKFPEIAPKPTPGDKGTNVQVPYRRVTQPPKSKARYTPDDAVPGYGRGGKGGVWKTGTGKVIATSKSPTTRLSKPSPELASRPTSRPAPRAPKPPLNATQRATKKANPGLYAQPGKKRTIR
jgi:hypothetical protein